MDKGIQLPQGRIQWSRPGGETIVVVAGGRRPDPQWLRKAAAAFPVAAADRGADHCKAAGVVPGFLYGDRDSTAPGAWEEFVRKGARAKTYPVNKNDTDLSLVLQDLPGDRTVLATGIWEAEPTICSATSIPFWPMWNGAVPHSWQTTRKCSAISCREKDFLLRWASIGRGPSACFPCPLSARSASTESAGPLTGRN